MNPFVAQEQRRRLRETVDALRKEAGMTQTELAEELAMPRSTLNAKLRGRRQTWWTNELCMLLDVFRDEQSQRRIFDALSPSPAERGRRLQATR